jgi:hypothetical protein
MNVVAIDANRKSASGFVGVYIKFDSAAAAWHWLERPDGVVVSI